MNFKKTSAFVKKNGLLDCHDLSRGLYDGLRGIYDVSLLKDERKVFKIAPKFEER